MSEEQRPHRFLKPVRSYASESLLPTGFFAVSQWQY